MHNKNILKMLSLEYFKTFEQLLILFSSWLVLTSFYEADWWHFTDPQTTGISYPAIALLLLALFTSPILLCFKCIRGFRPNPICRTILKLFPAFLLVLSSMPFLKTFPWARTGILAAGVLLMPLLLTWLYSLIPWNRPRTTEKKICSTAVSGKGQLNLFDSDLICSSKDKRVLDFNRYFGENFLLAVLLSMSIRYCSGTINVFYENWVFPLSLFFLIVLILFVRSHFLKRKLFCFFNKTLRFGLSTKSTKTETQKLDFVNGSNRNGVTDSNQDCGLTDLSKKPQSESIKGQVIDMKKCTVSDETISNCSKLHLRHVVCLSISGCVHGFALGVLLMQFLWFFSSPSLLWRWSDRGHYTDGVLVIFTFAIGLVGSHIFRPERIYFNLFSLDEAVKNKKSAGVLALITFLITLLLAIAAAFMLQSDKNLSLAGSLIFCLILPYLFTVNSYAIDSIMSIIGDLQFRFIAALPGFIVLFCSVAFFMMHLVFISFINPQLTLVFLGRIDVILILISTVLFFLLLSFISVFMIVSRLFDKKPDIARVQFSGKPYWSEKIRRKLTTYKRLVVLALLSAAISIISVSIGPQFKARQCLSFDEAIANVAAATQSANNTHATSFSVLTWNILFGYDKRGSDNLACVGKVLDIVRPDIVALQESGALPPYWGGKDISSFIAGYFETNSYPGVNPKEASLGVDLFTGFRVLNHRSFLLPTEENKRLPRYSLVHITCVFMARTVHVFNVHAVFKNWTSTRDNPSPFAKVSALQMQFVAQKVLELNESAPTIIMGDFNLNPYEPELDVFHDMGFKSALHEMRDGNGPSTINNRFAVIDHVFYRDLALVQAIAVMETSDISDHYPVVARFELLT